jgi:2-polyprenyl-3-methyl-5-hydroxy-6-metoxy-1,4-benzoquinol methylase
MKSPARHQHWEKIYQTKSTKELSWYQTVPEISLDFIRQLHVPFDASIIDVGGGDSLLVDYLLDLGFQHITVLDISETAIGLAKQRLGPRAAQVNWIVTDIAAFVPGEKYDFWHDRATFHFLTEEREVDAYIRTLQMALNPSGIVVLGTFSTHGPEKCSGLPVRRYSEKTMANKLSTFFRKIKCLRIDHITPLNKVQNFIFCSFRKQMAV